MPPRVDTCPHCGRQVETDEEFCTACGAWLYGGPQWPAPPQAVPVPERRVTDPDAEPVPLQLGQSGTPGSGRAVRVAIVLLAVAAGVAWAYAERMIVARDDRLNWDIAWIVAATITVLLGVWLLVDAVRRGRTCGWAHGWRVWEPPV